MPSKKTEQRQEEVEIKLRVADHRALTRRLVALGAKLQVPRVHEMNTLYDTPENTLERRGQMLRIRVERQAPRAARGARTRPAKARPANPEQGALLTHKGPIEANVASRGSPRRLYKVREEREVRVMDADAIAGIIEALGLRPSFRYEKYRTTYRLPLAGTRRSALTVDLDETPVGDFLELEGERGAIDRAATLLGYGPSDYVDLSYGALWREFHGLATPRGGRKRRAGTADPASGPGDMLFSLRKRKPSSPRR